MSGVSFRAKVVQSAEVGFAAAGYLDLCSFLFSSGVCAAAGSHPFPGGVGRLALCAQARMFE